MIKFLSVNAIARTATFDIDGKEITRKIPAQFEGTIDDYLSALVKGLAIEMELDQIKELGETSFKQGDIVF